MFSDSAAARDKVSNKYPGLPLERNYAPRTPVAEDETKLKYCLSLNHQGLTGYNLMQKRRDAEALLVVSFQQCNNKTNESVL